VKLSVRENSDSWLASCMGSVWVHARSSAVWLLPFTLLWLLCVGWSSRARVGRACVLQCWSRGARAGVIAVAGVWLYSSRRSRQPSLRAKWDPRSTLHKARFA